MAENDRNDQYSGRGDSLRGAVCSQLLLKVENKLLEGSGLLEKRTKIIGKYCAFQIKLESRKSFRSSKTGFYPKKVLFRPSKSTFFFFRFAHLLELTVRNIIHKCNSKDIWVSSLVDCPHYSRTSIPRISRCGTTYALPSLGRLTSAPLRLRHCLVPEAMLAVVRRAKSLGDEGVERCFFVSLCYLLLRLVH